MYFHHTTNHMITNKRSRLPITSSPISQTKTPKYRDKTIFNKTQNLTIFSPPTLFSACTCQVRQSVPTVLNLPFYPSAPLYLFPSRSLSTPKPAMKQLLGRQSRVAAADTSAASAVLPRTKNRPKWWRRRILALLGAKEPGYLPVRVGEEGRRLAVRLELVNHPAFAELLRASAEAYGYSHGGALRIACSVHAFELLLAALDVEAATAAAAGGCELVS